MGGGGGDQDTFSQKNMVVCIWGVWVQSYWGTLAGWTSPHPSLTKTARQVHIPKGGTTEK